MAIIFEGKVLAAKKAKKLERKAMQLKESGVVPTLSTILVGDDPASVLYVSLKKKAAEKIGAKLIVKTFDSTVHASKIVSFIDKLNLDASIHGIMVQLPLPGDLRNQERQIVSSIFPTKDVDGLRPDSLFVHPTSKAVVDILKEAESSLRIAFRKVCVVGGTGMVGEPLVRELLKLGYDVDSCNRETADLKRHTRAAEVVVSATGKEGIITGDMVSKGSVIIDVGSPKGDVSFDEVFSKSSFITPVPGGVGPVTIVSLLDNLFSAL